MHKTKTLLRRLSCSQDSTLSARCVMVRNSRPSASLAGMVISLLLFLGTNCRQTSEPPVNKDKDPRTYTWQRDTLGDGTYQTSMSGIWGSSANDVYVVGSAGLLYTGKIWHYDGSRWTDLTTKYVEAFPAQQIFPWACVGVFGFSSTDVWIVGYCDTTRPPTPFKKGFVMHYNGVSWQGTVIPQARALFSVWGKSSSDLWVGGEEGLFFHSNGSTWQQHNIADTIMVQRIVGSDGSNTYAGGFTHNNTSGIDYHSLLEWDGSGWKVVEIVNESSGNLDFTFFLSLDNGTLYSCPYTAVKKRIAPGSWQTLFSNSAVYLVDLTVKSATNIFAVGRSSGETIYHYNGKDWYRFPLFVDSNIYCPRVWSDGSATFVVEEELRPQATALPRTFVLHGK